MNSTTLRMKRCVSFVAIFFCLLFLSCRTFLQVTTCTPINKLIKATNNNGIDEDDLIPVNDLQRCRNLWLEQKIVDYDMVVSFTADGLVTPASPVLIKVRSNKAISTQPVSKETKGSVIKYSMFDTVEKMFDEIQEEINNGANQAERNNGTKCTEVFGIFNSTLGYPEKIQVRCAGGGLHGFRLSIDKLDIVPSD